MGRWRAHQQSCGAKQPELSHDAEDALQTPENAHHGKSPGVGTLCPHVGASLVCIQRQTITNRFPRDSRPENGCITGMENEQCQKNWELIRRSLNNCRRRWMVTGRHFPIPMSL